MKKNMIEKRTEQPKKDILKVLLVVPKFVMFPVGIAYIASTLKKAGHQVDGFVVKDINTLREHLRERDYDVIATGGLSSDFMRLKRISDVVKKTKAKFIVGGGIITSEPELMSRALGADYAVIGEGEKTMVELLLNLARNSPVSSVDGIGYFDHDKFKTTQQRKSIQALDSLPWPDYDSFDFSQFLDSMKPSDQYYCDIFDYPKEYPIITSRGCPFSCSFCYQPLGKKYRQRSIDSVMEELRTVIPKYHINIVAIYDELFSYDERRITEFCHRFREFSSGISWEIKWFCQMRVAGLNEKLLDLMRESGCFMVSYGFESYNPAVLKSMKKEITPEQIHYAVHATLDRNISVQGCFIFGDKAETHESALETLEFWKDHLEVGILLVFVITCPNSPLYQYCIEKSIIKNRLEFIKNHSFDVLNMTGLSNWDFLKLKLLVFRYKNKYSISVIPLKRTVLSLTVQCPHCKEILEYNNYSTPHLLDIKMMFCRKCRKRFFVRSRWSRFYTKISLVCPLLFYIFEKGNVRLRMFAARNLPRSWKDLLLKWFS